MKQISIGSFKRKCPYCKRSSSQSYSQLSYFKENGNNDLYYCKSCFKLVEWNGDKIIKVEGEAYPNRDK